MYRAVYQAYGTDWRLNTAPMAEEYEFVAAGSTWFPGLPRHERGRDGYMRIHRQLLEALAVKGVELEELHIVGERRVAALLRFVVGSHDVTVDQRCLDVHDFREDGALVRQTVYFDIEEGMRAVGL